MSFKYHANGSVRWNGFQAFYPNEQIAWNGSCAYYANGKVAWTGSHAYFENGQPAWNGHFSYNPNGQIEDTDASSKVIDLRFGFRVLATHDGTQFFIDGIRVA